MGSIWLKLILKNMEKIHCYFCRPPPPQLPFLTFAFRLKLRFQKNLDLFLAFGFRARVGFLEGYRSSGFYTFNYICFCALFLQTFLILRLAIIGKLGGTEKGEKKKVGRCQVFDLLSW